MRIEDCPINQVFITPDFAEDEAHVYYINRPVWNKVQKYLRYFEQHKKFPNSFRPHRARDYGIFIGWISVGSKAWRVLFEYDFADGTMLLLRLNNHDEMDVGWKNN